MEELSEALGTSPNLQFIPIHSSLELEAQLLAFTPSPQGVTKVIAATNAAESSLTLPDVDLVIDTGVEKVQAQANHGKKAHTAHTLTPSLPHSHPPPSLPSSLSLSALSTQAVVWNSGHGAAELRRTWVSKASATQVKAALTTHTHSPLTPLTPPSLNTARRAHGPCPPRACLSPLHQITV